VLVGSLSRDDFIEGGSDVDLLFVHEHGELPSRELGAHPALREAVRLFGEPLLAIGRHTGRQKPFVVDTHFADAHTVETQPRWADPAGFLREHMSHDRSLWLHAFDLVENGRVLWGESPVPALRVYEPAGYLPCLARELREELARLQSYSPHPVRSQAAQQVCAFTGGLQLDGVGMLRVGALRGGADLPEAIINDWKRLTGQLLTALALQHGAPSLRKRDIFRHFNLRVPYFPGKDFAGHIWSEYLYGIVYDERDEWVRRCGRLCENGLKVLDSC
ncbi:MAG: hypothetical protein WCP21_14450, partial [Armatimonadota bacterium]